MKLVSYGPAGSERAGVIVGDSVIDINAADPGLPSSVRGILAGEHLPRVHDLATRADDIRAEAKRALDDVRLGPPVPDPTKIICLGLNYRDHAEEQNKQPPDKPMLFSKGPNVLCGHNDTVPFPRVVEHFDYEAEFAFVIGRRAKHVDENDAMDYVAGYGVFMDLSARDLQRSERQWFRAKSVDGSGPFGPYLVTRDEIDDPHALDISLDVNGERRQQSNTSNLVFRVGFLVHYLSQTMTLEPGDIIATGTPGGVGEFRDPPVYLKPGDRLTARIEHLGELAVSIG